MNKFNNNTDGNLAALDSYMDQLDKDMAEDEAIIEMAIEVEDKLTAGEILHINGESYSMDDFVSDFDIDSTYFCAFMKGDSSAMLDHSQRQLTKYATEIATMIIEQEINHED